MQRIERALSIQQPYADAILSERLDHTRRTRPTKRRGRVYVYAGRQVVDDDRFPPDPNQEVVTGAVLGAVDIIDCKAVPNGFHWVLANPERFAIPRRPVNSPQPTFWTPQFSTEAPTV